MAWYLVKSRDNFTFYLIGVIVITYKPWQLGMRNLLRKYGYILNTPTDFLRNISLYVCVKNSDRAKF